MKSNRLCANVDQVIGWLKEYRNQLDYQHQQIAFSDSDQWLWQGDHERLYHKSGKFFSVVGFAKGAEQRPLIDQPEVGTQGFIFYRQDGKLYVLAQARTEPGNLNLVELGPTIQATWSNYTRVHTGKKTIFLDLFHDESSEGKRLADCVLPELGTFFFRKYNRNVLIEVDDPSGYVSAQHKWVPLSVMNELFAHDHIVNNDARLVYGLLLSMLQKGQLAANADDCSELLSELSARQKQWQNDVLKVQLNRLDGWVVTDSEIVPENQGGYKIIQLQVNASDREVKQWDQPMVQTLAKGVVLLLARRQANRWEVLLEFTQELGNEHGLLLGPSAVIEGLDQVNQHSSICAVVNDANAVELTRHSCSEEGGRFYLSNNEYRVVDTTGCDDANLATLDEDNYQWVSLANAIDLYDKAHVLSDDCRGIVAVFLAYLERQKSN